MVKNKDMGGHDEVAAFRVGVSLYDYYSEDQINSLPHKKSSPEEVKNLSEQYREDYTMYEIKKDVKTYPVYGEINLTTYGKEKIIFYVEAHRETNSAKTAILKTRNIWESSDDIFETISKVNQIQQTAQIDKLRIQDFYKNSFMAGKIYFEPVVLKNVSLIIWTDNSKGRIFESIKQNYRKDISSVKDFGTGHSIFSKIESNFLKKDLDLILEEIKKNQSFENIIGELRGIKYTGFTRYK